MPVSHVLNLLTQDLMMTFLTQDLMMIFHCLIDIIKLQVEEMMHTSPMDITWPCQSCQVDTKVIFLVGISILENTITLEHTEMI